MMRRRLRRRRSVPCAGDIPPRKVTRSLGGGTKDVPSGPSPCPAGPWHGARAFYAIDPDGVILELIEPAAR